MTPEVRSYPTKYQGCQFRSRLEARWAAFFDLVRWPWVYEPFDLPGYSPDFLIRKPVDMIAEVKPCLNKEAMISMSGKIIECKWPGWIVMLGASPVKPEDGYPPGSGSFGIRRFMGDPKTEWDDLVPCGKNGVPMRLKRMIELWNEASSEVQWNPR